MYPKSHTQENKRERKYFALYTILIIIYLFIAPLLHEFFHIIFLSLNGYRYYSVINFSIENGIYGSIVPISYIDKYNSVIFLSIGLIGNFLIAFLFIFLSKFKKNLREIFTFISMGFILEPVSYLFSNRGDIINILTIFGCEKFKFIFPFLGTLMFFSIIKIISENLQKG